METTWSYIFITFVKGIFLPRKLITCRGPSSFKWRLQYLFYLIEIFVKTKYFWYFKASKETAFYGFNTINLNLSWNVSTKIMYSIMTETTIHSNFNVTDTKKNSNSLKINFFLFSVLFRKYFFFVFKLKVMTKIN